MAIKIIGVDSGVEQDVDAIVKASRSIDYALHNGAARSVAVQSKLTYAIAGSFTPAATPTDLVIIEGSATKIIRILSMVIGTTNTAAGSQQFHLIKRSAADTTGTFVSAGTPVPLDATNAPSTVNRVGHFTANPGALGAAVGTINITRQASPAAIPATWGGVRHDGDVEMLPWMTSSILDQPVTLNAVTQCLAINFNGVALVAGQTHTYRIVWMEE